jgi:ribosome-associated heat shock protein Hsp15
MAGSWSLEVARVIDKRVGAPLAAECMVDHSPPPPKAADQEPAVFARDRGSGRPT